MHTVSFIRFVSLLRSLHYLANTFLFFPGFSGGGYIHSFGAAGMVSDLVEELLLDSRLAKL